MILTPAPIVAISSSAATLYSLLAAVALLSLVWLLSVWLRDAGIIDPVWGIGFIVIAWLTRLLANCSNPRSLLLCLLVTAWGLRLGSYLLWRNAGKQEDYRYRAMREKHGERFWIVSLFTVFWLQAGIMWIVSLPIQFGQMSTRPLGWIDALGVLVFMIGLYFEALGDWQLARFKANPDNKGKVLDQGLWRYTRHPNYFGDFCVWWGLYLVALAGGAWWTLFSPLIMSFFLIKVSGVAMLEQTIADRRPEYHNYIRRTSAFVPWPPMRT